MNGSANELVIRAGALYLPMSACAAVVLLRPPDRAKVAAALVGTAWNLPALLALNALAPVVGWWQFNVNSASVDGTPVDLWLGWAVIWGALPALAPGRSITGPVAALVVADLIVMPLADPVVALSSSWLIGETVGVCVCLVPGLVLARCTERGAHVRARAALQAIAFAGLLLYVLPAAMFAFTDHGWQTLLGRPLWQLALGAVALAPAGVMALWAVFEFAATGCGTPFPLDPPQRLVTSGPYAYIANPMQLGGTIILVGWAWLTGSLWLLGAAAVAVAFSAGVAGWQEDDELSKRYGGEWRRYRATVRTWLPTTPNRAATRAS
jgi:protein-S-isoprenylcysteine O-methyltransferase Ste14